MPDSSQPTSEAPVLKPAVFWILFALIALGGIAGRVIESASWRKTGFDELLYQRYVNLMDGGTQRIAVFQKDQSLKEWEFDVKGSGAAAMPSLTSLFLRTQAQPDTECELPPTRFLYIYTSWVWKNARFGDMPPLTPRELGVEWRMKPAEWEKRPRTEDADHRDPALVALHDVACAATILAMIAAGLFASRMLGRGAGLGVMALMACDPLQLHLSQHAMIDAFFLLMATLCMWTTWECLRAPQSRGWLAAHTVALALMVLTKENSFFVYCGLAVAVLAAWRMKIGAITPRFIVCSIAGSLAGVLILVTLAGGFEPFIGVYETLVAKAQKLPYAQLTGDGPWYRYLLDLMIVSPIVLCLALGALFSQAGRRKELAFLAVFVGASYLIMCNIKFGMNLRYTTIWALPLRAAAFIMVWELCVAFGKWRALAAGLILAGLCAYDVRQYLIFNGNKEQPLYETIPSDMLRSIKVIKDPDKL